MKNKLAAVMLSFLIGAVLVAASCAPATKPAAEEQVTGEVKEKEGVAVEEEVEKEEVVPAEEKPGKPKYGGVLNTAWTMSPQDFDQAYRTAWLSWTLDVTNETSFVGDILNYNPEDLRGLCIERWETPRPELWILKVRKGVHFHNKPPVNGREMTAEDVVVSYKRMFTMPGSWLAKVPNRPIRIEATDKYTVEVEFPRYDATMPFRIFDTIFIVPREMVWDDEGNETEKLRDWHNACGTGPFMLVDYVPDSFVVFKKNPNYWQKDPFHPENSLPYMDGINVKIIPEVSTIIAALRTGKIDFWRDITWEQAQSLKKTNPELCWVEVMSRQSYEINLRTDIEPYSDKRVRQALSMAIDRNSMINDLYHGAATYMQRMYSPYEPDVYIPYEELPPDVKQVLTHDPAKARELLAEAGYPDGFRSSIMTVQTYSDEATFIAQCWNEIGVETDVDIRENAVFTSIKYSFTYPHALFAPYLNQPSPNAGDVYLCGHYSNFSVVCDEKWDEMYAAQVAEPDYDEMVSKMRDMALYSLEQSWVIPVPCPHLFVFWQPWLKQWEGAFLAGCYHYFQPLTYAWLDK